MPMTHEVLDDTAHVHIEGELTIYTVAELSAALLPHLGTAPHLALDLSDVTDMDGAGLQLLALIQREAGAAFSLSGQSQAVTQVLQLCRSTLS